MSSTLFGRGTNGQVGLRRRAEEVNRAIFELDKELDNLKDLPKEFTAMRGQVMSVESNINGVNVRITNNESRISILEGRVAMMEVMMAQIKDSLAKLEAASGSS